MKRPVSIINHNHYLKENIKEVFCLMLEPLLVPMNLHNYTHS